MAHTRQSRLDSGLRFQVKVLIILLRAPSSLSSGQSTASVEAHNLNPKPLTVGIVHRDLKPENLLYASGDEKDPAYDVIKLADFGLVLPPPHTPGVSNTHEGVCPTHTWECWAHWGKVPDTPAHTPVCPTPSFVCPTRNLLYATRRTPPTTSSSSPTLAWYSPHPTPAFVSHKVF